MMVLADVCSEVIDCEHKTAPEDVTGTARAVGTPHVRHGRLNLEAARRISDDTYAAWTRRGVPTGGDIVLTREAPVGDVGMVPPNALVALGQRTVLLRPDTTRVQPRYLLYLMQGPAVQRWMADRSSGSTVAHLNVADVREIELPDLPGLDHQRAVVAVLGALDDKIDVNERVAGGAERLAVAELARIADDCEWLPLGDVAVHRKTTVDPSQLDGNVQHYSIPSFDRDQLPGVEPALTIKSNKLAVADRAVLVSRLNPRMPRVWFALPLPELPAVCSTEFLVLEPLDDLSRGALFAACAQPDVAKEFTQRAGGTSGSHQRIKPADALSVPVPVPKDDPLGETLTALLEGAVHARREANTLSELRDTLLPKLLSGEIRVADAVELLEASP